VGTEYPVIDVLSTRYDPADTDDFRDLDRFNRVTTSRWTKDLATDKDFYDIDLSYDRNSNIESQDDNVHGGHDVKYALDNLNRLTDADEGTLSGGSITSRSRRQQWSLIRRGTGMRTSSIWTATLRTRAEVDGLTEVDEDNYNSGSNVNFNVANELLARDTDNDGTDDYTLTHDAVGNMTDDGENYEYEYDVFGRLRKIKDTGDQSLVAEYKYNGLGYPDQRAPGHGAGRGR
jgi:YD repeat-containing protein